jgi:hypothetical protein
MSKVKHKPVVFTAQLKVFFYCRDAVCQFVFEQDAVPLNPFRVFEYFLGDRVDRDLVRQGNNNLIRIADEVWVFGSTIADGVFFEILLARKLEKPVRFFSIDNRADKIHKIVPNVLHFEKEVYRRYRHVKKTRDALLSMLLNRDIDLTASQLQLFTDEVHR